MVAVVSVGEFDRASLHASIDGRSCELDVLEEYVAEGPGDMTLLETSECVCEGTWECECGCGPSRTREKVLSECTATKLRRLDKGLGWAVADDAGDTGDGGSPGTPGRGDALIGVILAETSDGGHDACAVGSPGPGGYGGAEG